jgi:hypothetical protein
MLVSKSRLAARQMLSLSREMSGAPPLSIADLRNHPKALAKESPLMRCWRRHAYILPSFFISVLVWTWFVTWGDWKLFEPGDFCGFYDALARSIMHGHFDVPRDAIGVEAFTFEGKTYGYFGIGPALLRIPLVLIFPQMDGLWSRLMILIAATISLACAYGIMRTICLDAAANTRVQRLLHSLFILSAGVGSTTVFLVGRSYTYHEALMWAGAFALLFTCTILRYFSRPRGSLLTLAGAFVFMSFHCRPTVGAGALLAMAALAAILIWRDIGNPQAANSFLALRPGVPPVRHALIATIIVVITLSTYFGVNYAKFRTFDAVPLRYYDFYAEFPKRLKATEGKQIHLKNIPTGLATYFGVHGARLKNKFPWFYMEEEATFIGSPANDLIEPFSTVPISMPALTLLSLIGASALIVSSSDVLRHARLPAVTLFMGGGIMLATVCITERYLHDLYPALVIAAAAGVARIESSRHNVTLTALLGMLSIISVTLNCSFSLVNQRENLGAPPAKVAEYEYLQESINRVLHRGPPPPD